MADETIVPFRSRDAAEAAAGDGFTPDTTKSAPERTAAALEHLAERAVTLPETFDAAAAAVLTGGAASDADGKHTHAGKENAGTAAAAVAALAATKNQPNGIAGLDASGNLAVGPSPPVAGTGTSGSPQVLTAADNGKTFTNAGAAEMVYFTLPATPIRVTFIVTDSVGIRVTPPGGQTVMGGAYVESVVVNNVIGLARSTATAWVAVG